MNSVNIKIENEHEAETFAQRQMDLQPIIWMILKWFYVFKSVDGHLSYSVGPLFWNHGRIVPLYQILDVHLEQKLQRQ